MEEDLVFLPEFCLIHSCHTIHHQKQLTNLVVVESWLKDNEMDKSSKYGFQDLPVGTWFVSVKVNDKSVWDNFVKSGKVKGFSIEGYFTDKAEKTELSIVDEIKELIKSHKN